MDNSGGVDCSDREVNIKVLLRLAADDGALSEDERRDLLFSMKDELAEMVLGNNYRQSQAISMMDTRAAESLVSTPISFGAWKRVVILIERLKNCRMTRRLRSGRRHPKA